VNAWSPFGIASALWAIARPKIRTRNHSSARFNLKDTTTTHKMGKKRKAGAQPFGEPKELENAENSKMRITTFEDVADSEDEFHINRDKILLEEGPAAKRVRKWKEQGMCSALW
jgi:hypothetical protein